MQFLSMSEQLTRISQCLLEQNSNLESSQKLYHTRALYNLKLGNSERINDKYFTTLSSRRWRPTTSSAGYWTLSTGQRSEGFQINDGALLSQPKWMRSSGVHRTQLGLVTLTLTRFHRARLAEIWCTSWYHARGRVVKGHWWWTLACSPCNDCQN